MSTTREMPGLIDLTGQQFGTLKVQRMVSRPPEPKYAVACAKCGTESTAIYTRLRNGAARCQFSGCGKPSKQRDRLSEERRRTVQREAERAAEEHEAAEQRMNAECEADGWERPTKYAPTPSKHVVMSERDRLELRERREAEEQERRNAERPRLEAERKAAEEQALREAQQHERNEKQRAYWREWVLNDRDPKLFVSPAMLSASLPVAEADAFNSAEVKKFISETNDFAEYRSPANADSILGYLIRNGVRIVDVETIRAAFLRLRDLGILTKKPAPRPVDKPRPVNRPVEPSGPRNHRG